jgi:molybdopterin biosynthesis enzyme
LVINGIAVNANDVVQQEMKVTSGHFWKVCAEKNVQFVAKSVVLSTSGMAVNANDVVQQEMKVTSGYFWKVYAEKNVQFVAKNGQKPMYGLTGNVRCAVLYVSMILFIAIHIIQITRRNCL